MTRRRPQSPEGPRSNIEYLARAISISPSFETLEYLARAISIIPSIETQSPHYICPGTLRARQLGQSGPKVLVVSCGFRTSARTKPRRSGYLILKEPGPKSHNEYGLGALGS